MDNKRILLIAACAAFILALAGGIWLSGKGVTVPVWLAALLTGGGWLLKSPLAGSESEKPKDGDK